MPFASSVRSEMLIDNNFKQIIELGRSGMFNDVMQSISAPNALMFRPLYVNLQR